MNELDESLVLFTTDAYNKRLIDKKINLEKGKFNVLPFPFQRASNQFPGIEKPTYINVSAETKFGKTSFASAAFLLEPLWKAYQNPNLKIWYHYCNLEESENRIKDRIVIWLLYKYTNGRIRIGYRDLNSATVPLPEEVLSVLKDSDFIKIRNFFFNHIEFDDNSYPTGIDKGIRKFVSQHGEIIRGEEFISEDILTGKKTTHRVIAGYKEKDPDAFLIVFFDNINNITPESGQNLLSAITKVSKNFKDARNKYSLNIVALQQQNSEGDNNDAFKNNKVEPRITGLADCKQVGRDLNTAIGIFAPSMKYEHLPVTDPKRKSYKEYDLIKLGDFFRTIIFMADRDGESAKAFPMFFDGKVNIWEELPLPNDEAGLKKVYAKIEAIKKQEEKEKQIKTTYKQQHKIFFLKSSGFIQSSNKFKKFIQYLIKKWQ